MYTIHLRQPSPLSHPSLALKVYKTTRILLRAVWLAEEFCHSGEGWIKVSEKIFSIKSCKREGAQHTCSGRDRKMPYVCLWRCRKTIRFLSMMLFWKIWFAYRIVKHTHVQTPTLYLQLRERGTQHSVFWKHKAKRFFLQRSMPRLSHCQSNTLIANSIFTNTKQTSLSKLWTSLAIQIRLTLVNYFSK